MPASYVRHNPDGTTLEEFRELLSLRRRSLEDATREHGLGEPLPIPWRTGWKASIKILGRDRDGSLCAKIVVTGPGGGDPYVRKYRLTKAARLPSRLG